MLALSLPLPVSLSGRGVVLPPILGRSRVSLRVDLGVKLGFGLGQDPGDRDFAHSLRRHGA